jgi:hypothetical protein
MGCTRWDDAVRWYERYLAEIDRAKAAAKEQSKHITSG